MTSTAKQSETGFRRLIRMKRVGAHAADLLQEIAQSFYDCNTVDGKFEHAEDEQRYNDLRQTASDLQRVLGIVEDTGSPAGIRSEIGEE